MKRTLPALLLLVAVAAYAKKPPVKAKPPPPPPVEEVIPEEEPPPEELIEDQPDPDDTVPDATTSSSKKEKTDKNELTDDEAAGVAVGGLCCCAVILAGLIALIVWLVKRGSGTPKPVQGNYPQQPQPGFSSPPMQTAGGMQLSIFALALEPQAREIVEQQLSQLGISSVPTTPEARGRLVREAARALLTVQPSWRQFGYGEKSGIPDLGAAENSYRSASEDFRGRATSVGSTASGDSGLVVVTLLVCCRRSLLGVSRLDDPLQVRNVLEDRMRVTDADLLGTELLWAPAAQGGRVTEAEIGLRFPEMLPLPRSAI